MERKAPKEVNYQDILPLALPSSSNRRKFMPQNGQKFSPQGTNIIRIDVNADSMLDASHSYLQFDLKNTCATALSGLAPDVSVPVIKSMRLESGGITLEETHEYGRLMALLEYAQFGASNFTQEYSVLSNQSQKISAQPAVAGATAIHNQPSYNDMVSANAGRILTGETKTYCVPLVSAILNCEKYIPLILSNAGLNIVLEIAPAVEIGCWSLVATPAVGILTGDYEISNVAYVAHLVDMDRSFYDALRSEMALSGSIAIHGQTWKHYGASIGAMEQTPVINIPARAKSIKSIFSTFRTSVLSTNDVDNACLYSTGVLQRQGITSWQYKVGSVSYPQSAVAVSGSQLAPTLCEVLKGFGKLGDISTNTLFSRLAYGANIQSAGSTLAGSNLQTFCIGYDCEGFQKSALESGINTAERALPISLELTKDAHNWVVQNDNYVCSDAFFYINSDGSISPST